MNNIDEYASSSRAVVKALEGLGFNGVELWKDPATKHYVFSVYHQPKSWTDPKDCVTFCSETIAYHDLRASDWTIREWLEEFLSKAEESEWDKDWHGQSLELKPLLENLRNVISGTEQYRADYKEIMGDLHKYLPKDGILESQVRSHYQALKGSWFGDGEELQKKACRAFLAQTRKICEDLRELERLAIL